MNTTTTGSEPTPPAAGSADETVVIVGTSLAGLRAAETLRRLSFSGRIIGVSAEVHTPYDRPPLSKDFLSGARDVADLQLRKGGVDDLGIEWHTGVRATALDVATKTVTLSDGSAPRYDHLLIATGAKPRMLPPDVCAPGMANVLALRTLDDAVALRSFLDAAENNARVCVIGAGFIGAEVAATCRGRGVAVTVLEAQEQPMIRGLGSELGAVCAQLHREHGVDLRLGVSIVAVEDDGTGTVRRVRLANGDAIECDVLVVGIGVVPETEWLRAAAGITVDNGVVCDECCRAAPNVYAIGDVARWPNPLFDGEMMRLEHWTNAAEQGSHVADSIVSGEAKPFAPVPFVWSDQYDCKIQSVGRFDADHDIEIVHGDLASRKFVALFGRDGLLRGALGFSSPRFVMKYRRMISERATFDAAIASAKG